MIDFLHIRTLSLMFGLSSMSMAGIMVYISMTRVTYPGFRHWTLGFILCGLGMILTSLRHIAPGWISILAANECTIAFAALLALGLAKFLDRPYRLWLPITVLSMALACFVYFTYFRPSVAARVSVLSVAVSLLFAYSFFLLSRHGRQHSGLKNNLLNSVLILLSLWGLARACITPVIESHIDDFLLAGALQGISYIIYTLGCMLIMGAMITLNAQRMEIELASADQEIRNMSRLIPICASCKKVRDDQGYWSQVEEYISTHSDAKFSHGLCPDCIRKLYPEVADSLLNKK